MQQYFQVNPIFCKLLISKVLLAAKKQEIKTYDNFGIYGRYF
jgi:hypothetical protein